MSANQDDELLLDYLHGKLAADRVQQLQLRLRSDRGLGRQLQRLAADECVIAEWARSQHAAPTPTSALWYRRWSAVAALGFAVAAALLIAVSFWGDSSPQNLATIVRVEGPASLDDALQAGRRLAQGEELRLDAGWAEIVYRTGPRVMLAGPAEFQVTAARAGRLSRGTLAAESHDGQFVIETPAGRVTDIGTRFGVVVLDDKQSAVEVFAGSVLVAQAENPASSATLVRGTAALLDRSHAQPKTVAAGLTQLETVRQQLATKSTEAVSDQFVRGGEWANEVQREDDVARMLLKRDPWRRLGVCRKAWMRFELGHDRLAPGLVTFSFRSGNRHEPANQSPHFVGTVSLYGLRRGFRPQGMTLGIDWSETELTWNNAPANSTHEAEKLTADAQWIGDVEVDAGPGGSEAGTLWSVSIPDLTPFLQPDGSVTLMLVVSRQPAFDPNLYVVAHESDEFAGPMLTYPVEFDDH